MTRRKSDKTWMARHVRDPYVKQAAREGYRSRAAFKLIELDARDGLLHQGQTVLDLGAAPGGWSQVAAARVGPRGTVIAADLVTMDAIPGVTSFRGDLRDRSMQARVAEILQGRRVDLVLCDMAPNLSGIAASDAARAQELVETAVELSVALLKPQGTLLVKVFHGTGLDATMQRLRSVFRDVAIRKPPASRSRSREVYALCRVLIGR